MSCLRALLSSGFVLMLIGCASRVTESTSASSESTNGTSTQPTADQPLIAGQHSARHGVAVVSIREVKANTAKIATFQDKLRMSDEPCLQVTFVVENTSKDTFLVINGWGKGSDRKFYARATDAKGNKYGFYQKLQIGEHVVDTDSDENRIKPGRTSVDVAVFEEPLGNATDLFVTFEIPKHGDYPAKKVTFKIPAEMWKR